MSAMRRFRYEAVDAEGRRSSGVLSAEDEPSAVTVLGERGLAAISLTAAPETAQRLPFDRDRSRAALFITSRQKLTRSGAVLLLVELSRLVSHGATLERALQITEETAPEPSAKKAAARWLQQIREGGRLSDAVAAVRGEGGALPPHAAGLVEAGEASGDLGAALTRLAGDMEREESVRRSIRATLAYPVFLAIAAIAAIALLLLLVVPQFKSLFGASGASISPEAAALIWLSDALAATWPLLVAGGAASVVFLPRLLRLPAIRPRWHRLLVILPGIGPLLARREAGRWSAALGALTAGGATLSEALRIAEGALVNTRFRDEARAALTAVSEGRNLSDAIAGPPWPTVIGHYARIGEETGRLGDSLTAASQILEAEAESQVKTLTAAAGPAIVLLLGAVIGTFVAVMFSAVLSVNDLAL
ncbi:MAG: type II secretion system F family protein [Pseudomonadota bacterium]